MVEDDDYNIHVVPLKDRKKHIEHFNKCWCNPKIIYENGHRIYVHNSADGRELVEEANLAYRSN